ncbi:MAG: hypothetical protein ACE5JV_04030, partial [Nitrososphaerales archaeon]
MQQKLIARLIQEVYNEEPHIVAGRALLERSESVPVLDRRQVLVSFVLLATLTLPLTFLHEAGHALICVYRDVPILSIGLGYTECAFKSADYLYYAFGGLFA